MEKKNEFEKIWNADGKVAKDAPGWAQFRKNMAAEFPSPFKGVDDPLAKAIYSAVSKLDTMKPAVDGPAFLGEKPELTIDFAHVKEAKLAPKMMKVDDVINECIKMYEGLPVWGHPLTMCNVIPPSNTASIIAAILTEIFAPNILEGEYSWNVHRAELETAGMIGDLLGWNQQNTGCIYTYGGSGCWTYHAKYALSRVLPDSRHKGVRVDGKIICSQQAHYTMLNSTDWTGLGMDNIIRIGTDNETNAMDLKELENVLKDLHSRNIPVISVVCTMGTTDANAFDPVGEVRHLLDKYPNRAPYGKTLLYCDSVTSWAWLVFNRYDFEKNPLGFSKEILPYLKKNAEAFKDIRHADALGLDFHKIGWSPYASSCFVYQNANEFENLLKRGESAYLQPRSPYNPLNYTLEVSRAATGAAAGWATLKYFGLEGFQSILGGILENRQYLQHLIDQHPDMVNTNAEDTGLVTLFRIYPQGTDAKKQYELELNDPDHRNELLANNELTHRIGNKLWDWYRSGKKVNGKYTPYMSFSTGFRSAAYNMNQKDSEAVIFSLKSYLMNVNTTPVDLQHVIDCVEAARDEVMSE